MPIGIKILGKKIGDLRRASHLKQTTLAEKAGMSVENIRRIEQTEVVATDRENIPKLASALGIPLAEFEKEVLFRIGEGTADERHAASILADREEERDGKLTDIELPEETADKIVAEAREWGISVAEMLHVMIHNLMSLPKAEQDRLFELHAKRERTPAKRRSNVIVTRSRSLAAKGLEPPKNSGGKGGKR